MFFTAQSLQQRQRYQLRGGDAHPPLSSARLVIVEARRRIVEDLVDQRVDARPCLDWMRQVLRSNKAPGR